jgi:hypothetical protein
MATSLDDAHLALSRPAGPISSQHARQERTRTVDVRAANQNPEDKRIAPVLHAIGGPTSHYGCPLLALSGRSLSLLPMPANDPKRTFQRSRDGIGPSLRGGERSIPMPDTVRLTARQKIAVLIDYNGHGLGVLPE